MEMRLHGNEAVTWECGYGGMLQWHATVAWEWDWILTECCSLTHLSIANVFSQQCSLIGAPVTNNEDFEQMIVCSGGVECTHRMLQAEGSHVHRQWRMRVYCNDNKKATAAPLAECMHTHVHTQLWTRTALSGLVKLFIACSGLHTRVKQHLASAPLVYCIASNERLSMGETETRLGQGVVTYMLPVEALTTTTKFFEKCVWSLIVCTVRFLITWFSRVKGQIAAACPWP